MKEAITLLKEIINLLQQIQFSLFVGGLILLILTGLNLIVNIIRK